MKKTVISMKLHKEIVTIKDNGLESEHQINLPEGCMGIMFVFESKKAAREFDSKAGLCEVMVGER